MGPWYVRDERFPFRPGCSYATLQRLIERRQIGPDTVIRGPATNQFWELASRTPSVAHLLGICHQCGEPVRPDSRHCPHCHVAFVSWPDRQTLGLMPHAELDEDEVRTHAMSDHIRRNNDLLELGYEHMHLPDDGRHWRDGSGRMTALVSAVEDDQGEGWEEGNTGVAAWGGPAGSTWGLGVDDPDAGLLRNVSGSADPCLMDLDYGADRYARRVWTVWVLPVANVLALACVFVITIAVVWKSFNTMPLRTSAAPIVPRDREATPGSAEPIDSVQWYDGEPAPTGDETDEQGAGTEALLSWKVEMDRVRTLANSDRLDLLLEARRLLGVVQEAVRAAESTLPADFDDLRQKVNQGIEAARVKAGQDGADVGGGQVGHEDDQGDDDGSRDDGG